MLIERLKAAGIGESYSLKVTDITDGLHAGGPEKVHPFHGVVGWITPPAIQEPVKSLWKSCQPG